MPTSSNSTEQLIAQAKLGKDAALISLIGQVGPRLRRAIDAELEAVHHDLDASQMWNEIQDEAKRRVGEFEGATETEFEAWVERIALRHIRYSLGGRAVNIETIVNTPKTETVSKPTPAANSDANETIAPGTQSTTEFDPIETLAPGNKETAEFDPNATIAPGDGDTIAPNAFATPTQDPHATITDLDSIPLAPQTTQIFGDYEILETIAKGGMGVVYKARQRSLNRIVALKMILAGQFADEDDIDRFHVEAEAAGKLRHSNIVGIYEVGECEGQHYFSMEYIEGRSLGDLVREHPLAPRAAATFVKTISEAMYYAHQEGVLHRDLKPSNVLVDDSDVPLITDFGLAKRTEEQSQRTAAGSVLGTPSYMPPEQASGKLDLISERSDVYSIGAILYELITGKPPFGAANPWETIKQVIGNEPVSPRLLNNSVPADLETICLKCLQKDQDRRYDTAQDLADELQRFLANEPILARPIGVIERSVRWCYRNPWPTAALAVLLLAVVGTSAGFYSASVAQRKAEMSRNVLLAAINKLFTDWADVKLLNEPGFEPIRAQLLASARELYGEMSEQLGKDPKIQQELGIAYFRLGRMMYHLRSYENAHEAIESGLQIQRTLHAARPADKERLHALGESLNLLGELFVATAPDIERLEQAEAVYDETIAIRDELVGAFAHNPEYEREWLNSRMNQAMAWQRMADLLADANQLDRAAVLDARILARAKEVQQARIALRDRLEDNSDVRHKVVHDLAQGYYNMANITWWQGDFEATGLHVTSAVQSFDELLETESGNLAYQYDQANCLVLGGDAKAEQAQLIADQDEALASYGQAMAIFERLAANSRRVPKYRAAVAHVHRKIGDLHFLFEQDQLALRSFQSAIDILEPMAQEYPTYQVLLDETHYQIDEIKKYQKPVPSGDSLEGDLDRGALPVGE